MDIGHDLKKHLEYLATETRKDRSIYRETIEILFKLHTYILANSASMKSFVKLDCETDFVFLKVWRYEAVRLFLFNLGWRQEKNLLVLKNSQHLQIGVNILWSFVDTENDLNSVQNTPGNEPKLIESLKNNLDQDNLDQDDDDERCSQGFSSEIESDTEEFVEPNSVVVFQSSTEIRVETSPQSSESTIDVSISRTKVESFDNVSTVASGSRDSTEYTRHEEMRESQRVTLSCHSSYSVPIPIKPFLSVAYFMQTALDAVVPLTRPVLSQSGSLISTIYKSTKQMLSGVSSTASNAVSEIGRLSAITISPGPQNSFNISSPNLFGSAAINIKSDRNNTIFNLITQNGPVDTGVSLSSKSDGNVYYSRNCCRHCCMRNWKK